MTGKGTGVQIRRMRYGDIDRVIAIAGRLKAAPFWTREVYEKALASGGAPERIALIAEADGEAIGFVVAGLIPPHAELETVAVKPELQRQGVARQLLTELLSELKKSQITEVMLEVRVSNDPARALYHSLGFIETGRRPGYYADPQEDAVLLRRDAS
jgi:ribosomal-protein-alanine N-acetyltransferase